MLRARLADLGLELKATKTRIVHLQEHLNWSADFAQGVVARARRHATVERHDGYLVLTPAGRALARKALAET